MRRTDLIAQGDRDLAEGLLAEPRIRAAVQSFEKLATDLGARRRLLGTALRLTPEAAPDVDATVETCRTTLGLEMPVETYVYPGPFFNAGSVRPESGRLFVILSSSLLEAFETDELRFVLGHELGHHVFDHHRLPVGFLLSGAAAVGPDLALRLFAWQRHAEISADRAGVLCAGGIDPSARALFKLASGLRGGRVLIRIDQFLAQAADLEREAARLARADEPLRSEWFASHPFSPLRLRAAELFARSAGLAPGGLSRVDLEARVQELMTLMDPGYLRERSDEAEAMRRLLFAGGIEIAAASGTVSAAAVEALERLLGPGSVSARVDPERIRQDLPSRIDAVRRLVPPLRRAQVIRDLCLIVRADRQVTEAEGRVLLELADAVGVDRSLVACTVEEPSAPHGTEPGP
ncbi:MAG: M48 family metallopeptidase [Planctomycetota bacterium]